MEVRFMKAWPYLDKEPRYFMYDVNRIDYQQSFFFLVTGTICILRPSEKVRPQQECSSRVIPAPPTGKGSGCWRRVLTRQNRVGHHGNPDVITSVQVFPPLPGKRNNELLKFKFPLTLKS